MNLSWPLNSLTALYDNGLAVGAPGSKEYVPTETTSDAPGYGPTNRQLSLRNGEPNSMDNQPAFQVGHPMGQVRSSRYSDDPLTLGVGAPGIPNFFHVGLRAANGQTDYSGAPSGLRMLVPPPDKWSAVRNVRKAKDVRLGFKQGVTSKARAKVPNVGA